MPVKDIVTTRHADMAQVFSQKLQAWAHNEDIFSPSMTATRQRLGIKSKFDIAHDVKRQSAALMWLLRTNLLFRLFFLGRYDLIKLYFYPNKKFRRNHKRFLTIRDNLIAETSPGSAKSQYEPKKLDHKTIKEIVQFLEHIQETHRHGNYLRLAVLKAQYHQVLKAYYAEHHEIYVEQRREILNILDTLLLNPTIREDKKIELRRIKQVIQDHVTHHAILPQTIAEDIALDESDVALFNDVIKGDLARCFEENKHDPNFVKSKSTFDKIIQHVESKLKATDDKFLLLIDSFQKEIKLLTEQNHQDVGSLLAKIIEISKQLPRDHLSSEAQEGFNTLLERLNQDVMNFDKSLINKKQCAENFRITLNELSHFVQDVAEFNGLVIQIQDVLNRDITLAYPEEIEIPLDTRLIQEIVSARPELILQPVAKPQSMMFSQHRMKANLNLIKQEQLKVAEVEYEIPEELHEQFQSDLRELLQIIKEEPVNEEEYNQLIPLLEKLGRLNTFSNTDINNIRSSLNELAKNDVDESALDNISHHCAKIENTHNYPNFKP